MGRHLGVRFREPGPDLTAAAVAGAYAGPPGLYVHIPFCRPVCPFCPYNKVEHRADLVAGYLRCLQREAASYLDALPGPFGSLYVGGGTPTLCLDELEPLLTRLPVTAERAIEVLPGHLTPQGADRLRDLGFTYVSVGVQSFDEGVLRHLRRPGSPRTNRQAVETALGAFDVVDVDLIFDTGYDDARTFLDDLAACFRLGAHQVSTYPLMRFGYTPFGKARHRRRREHDLLRDATGLAALHGYERRSVWTFHRPGSPAYSSITRPYYLGLGAGAASFTGELFCVNHFGLRPYRERVEAGQLPVARYTRLPRPAAAAYRAFWQAYTGSVPVAGDDPLLRHPVAALLRTLPRLMGWSRSCGDEVRLTPSGYDRYHDLERWVTYHLIEPLWAELTAEHGPAGDVA
ncbi:MAG TPA: radical SAM protein [Kineosporiaceae bacterium]|nr:radical SAM protein [Kineosporiaceae bacterium]